MDGSALALEQGLALAATRAVLLLEYAEGVDLLAGQR